MKFFFQAVSALILVSGIWLLSETPALAQSGRASTTLSLVVPVRNANDAQQSGYTAVVVPKKQISAFHQEDKPATPSRQAPQTQAATIKVANAGAAALDTLPEGAAYQVWVSL